MIKRLIAVLLAAFLLPVIPAAAAELPSQENTYEKNVTILNRFGIVNDVYVSLNTEESIIPDGVVNQAIYDFNGYNTGSADSYADITVGEAAAKLLHAIGCGYMSEAFGEGSVSYYRAASQVGLLNGIYADANRPLESGVFAKMLINAMSVEQKSGVKTGDEIEYISVGTFMDKHNIKKMSGTVEATEETSLESPNGAKTGKVVISGITYETNLNVRPYLGYKVEYYTQDKSGEYENLMCIFAKNENSVLNVDAEDIKSISSDMKSFSYYTEEDKVKTEKIKDGFSLIYNGKYRLKRDASILKPSLGNVTLLDNDNDGRYDMVFVNAYEVYIVDGVRDNKLYESNGKPEIDLSNTKNIRGIYRNGEESTADYLTRDDIAYVAADASGKYFEINASDEKVMGKVTSVDDSGNYRTYTIDGKEYSASKSLKTDNLLGSEGTFYLGPTGIIERQIVEKSGSYGILLSAADENGIGSKKVKIYMSNGITSVFDVADSAYLYDNGKKSKIGEEEIARLREYANIFAAPPEGIEPKHAPVPIIMYSVDSDENIKTISLPKLYTAEEAGDNRDKYTLQTTATKPEMLYKRTYTEYSSANRGFNPGPDINYSESMAKFANASTTIFEVPVENDGTIASDYYKRINVWNGNHTFSRRIWANFYNADENRIVGAVVVYKENANTDYIYGMLIENSTTTLNEDGEEQVTLNGYMDGEKVSLKVSNNAAISTAKLGLAMKSVPAVSIQTLGKGDFICMATNSAGEIVYIEPQLLGGYSNKDYVRYHNSISTVDYAEVVFGEVIAVNNSLLTLKLDMNMHNSEELIVYERNHAGAPKGFYDSTENKVKGKTNSISVGDYVYILRDSSRIMSIFVRK